MAVDGGKVWSPDAELKEIKQPHTKKRPNAMKDILFSIFGDSSAVYITFIAGIMVMMLIAIQSVGKPLPASPLEDNVNKFYTYVVQRGFDVNTLSTHDVNEAVNFTVPKDSNYGLSLYMSKVNSYNLCLWQGSPADDETYAYIPDPTSSMLTDGADGDSKFVSDAVEDCGRNGLVVAVGNKVDLSKLQGFDVAKSLTSVSKASNKGAK